MKVDTEKELWSKLLRPALHCPEEGRVAYKVQDAFVKGLPDVVVNIDGGVWWLELKIHRRPVRPTTPWRTKVTPEQSKFLRAWERAGGNAAVVIYDPHDELLYILDPETPDEVEGGDFPWAAWTYRDMSLKEAKAGRLLAAFEALNAGDV